ncbi:alpha/beta hydrolase [Pseudoalteromonas pernae]|uniref:alpha/beta hydrolase n=1 Tax=Pseudoalteromonas pernae TaxID=3118054 RepID=UPI003242D8C8
MKTLLSCLLLLLSFASSAANKTTAHKELSDAPEITVKLPASYDVDKTKRYPVIYVLDGTLNVELVQSMMQRLAESNGGNEHIVVGVESKNRLDDFAPTVNLDPRGPVGAGGGADSLLNYFESELIPTINNTYRTNNDKVIAGHSVAGLFVIHSYHSRPNLFQAHLAFSPAVWWGARETAQSAKQYVTSEQQTANFLYLNIGSEGGEMREVYDDLANTIARNRSVDLVLLLDEFSTADHDFTMAAGLYNALTGLYKYQQKMDI